MTGVLLGHRLPALPFIAVRSEITSHQPMCNLAGLDDQIDDLLSLPSELFDPRWKSFDNRNTLSIRETVYRRQIRPFGKTRKSLGDIHLRAFAISIFLMGLPPSYCNGSGSAPMRRRKRSSFPTRRVAPWTPGTTETGFLTPLRKNRDS